MSKLVWTRRLLTLLVCFPIANAFLKASDSYKYIQDDPRNGRYHQRFPLNDVSLAVSVFLGLIYFYLGIIAPSWFGHRRRNRHQEKDPYQLQKQQQSSRAPRHWYKVAWIWRLTMFTLVGSLVLALWNAIPEGFQGHRMNVQWPYFLWACLSFVESIVSIYCWRTWTRKGGRAWYEGGQEDEEGRVQEVAMAFKVMEDGRKKDQVRMDHALRLIQVQQQQIQQLVARRAAVVAAACTDAVQGDGSDGSQTDKLEVEGTDLGTGEVALPSSEIVSEGPLTSAAANPFG